MGIGAGFAIAMMAITVATTAYGMYQQHEAAERAEEVAGRNAKIEARRNEESVRRAEYNQDKKLASARAKLAATGVQMEGTPEYYLEELERTGDDEISWMEREGAWRVEAIKQGGQVAAEQSRAGMVSTFGQGSSQLAGQYSSYDYYYGGGTTR